MDATTTHHDPHDHVTPLGVYYAIFGALMILTIVTVAVAFVDLGNFNVVVALVVAVIKATLVVLYFMHLKYSTKLTWIVLASGLFWLMILFGITLLDYSTRGWMAAPPLAR